MENNFANQVQHAAAKWLLDIAHLAGRRVSCDKSGSAFTTPDTYAYLYNTRSELTNATATVEAAYRYGYAFDDIGNRATSSERGTNATYAANNLNQYMSVDAFVPQYDDDGNKNVSEVIASANDVAAHYEYAPFGALTVSRGASAEANPFRFSSEYAEDDTATVYYNYRHYEPLMGRWMSRDPIGDRGESGLYGFCANLVMGQRPRSEVEKNEVKFLFAKVRNDAAQSSVAKANKNEDDWYLQNNFSRRERTLVEDKKGKTLKRKWYEYYKQ